MRDTTDIVISVQLYYGTVPAISLPELSVHIRNPIEFGQTELSVNGRISPNRKLPYIYGSIRFGLIRPLTESSVCPNSIAFRICTESSGKEIAGTFSVILRKIF